MIDIKVRWIEPKAAYPFTETMEAETMEEATEKVKQLLDDIKDVAEWYQVEVK